MASRSKAGWVATGIAAIAIVCAPATHASPQLDWSDETAYPGETVVLEPTGTASQLGASKVRISDDTTLPAGWSVWGHGGTFRVAVPATAEVGHTVTLEFVTETGSLIGDVDVTVEEKDAVQGSSAQQTPWFTSFLATLGQLLN